MNPSPTSIQRDSALSAYREGLGLPGSYTDASSLDPEFVEYVIEIETWDPPCWP